MIGERERSQARLRRKTELARAERRPHTGDLPFDSGFHVAGLRLPSEPVCPAGFEQDGLAEQLARLGLAAAERDPAARGLVKVELDDARNFRISPVESLSDAGRLEIRVEDAGVIAVERAP